MRLDRTLNRDEVQEVLDACKDYQTEKWEVSGIHAEWCPFQGNHEGKGESTRAFIERHRPRIRSKTAQGKE
jgi:hypothetical protein